LSDIESTSNDLESTEDSEKSKKPVRRNFNPMAVYFRTAIMILISYFLFYAFGYSLLIMFMLLMEVNIL